MKHIRTILPTTIGLVFFGSVTTSLQAATILGVTIEDVSSEFSTLREAERIIDGSGFTEASGFHSAAGGDNINWITSGVGLGATPGDDPLPAFVTIDLEGLYDLDSVKIWNWNTSNTLTAGVNAFEISVAPTVGGTFTSLGNFNLAQAPGSDTVDYGQVVDLSSFGAADSARLVRLDITSNHGFDFELAGLSEIRFDGVVVPEPSGVALVAVSALGMIFRRRRSS